MKPNTPRSVLLGALHGVRLGLNSRATATREPRPMCKTSFLIKSLILAALVGSGAAPLWAGVIKSVTQLNGDTDRPEAKFSGQTFNVVNGSTTLKTDYTAPRFGEDALAMTDRLHEWNGAATNLLLPGYLAGAEYVLNANNNRDNANLTVTVELAAPARVYLLIDNRIGDGDAATPPDFSTNMTWVLTDGWTPVTNGWNRASSKTVPDEVGWDENGDGSLNQYGSVYCKLVTTASVTLYPQGESRNMYGIVVVPAVLETVSVTNGDPVSERPEPKFTSQNYDLVNGSIGIIFTNYTVPLFGEDVFAMTDRLHQWNGASATTPLPDYLLRNEYVAIANNYRDNASLQLDITLRARSFVYLLVDNRIGDGDGTNPPDFTTNMTWVVSDGWTPVLTGRNRNTNPLAPDEVGWDENGDGSINQWGSVYAKIIEPGVFPVRAQNESRDMYGIVAAPALLPAAPQGLAVLQVSDQAVKLGWKVADGCWTYTVKRASSAGGPYVKVAGPIGATTYEDSGLTTGSTYYYVVQGENLAGTGPDSGVLPATPLPTSSIFISTTEVWDGVANPHAGDGVTISGSGTTDDPFTYTIPKALFIAATGRINLHGANDANIKFLLEGGDLHMEAGAVLNIERYNIRSSRRIFVLDLNGTNSITGAGQIGPITANDSCPRMLTIQNVQNVSLANIDLHTQNVNTGPDDSRPLLITARGAVVVSGTINNSDQDSGGDGGCDVTIKANTIDVNHIDTRGMRNDPTGRAPYSGNVTLQALSPAGDYYFNDGVNNAFTNRLTVRGRIQTMGVDARTLQGGVMMQSVVLELVFGVIEVPPGTFPDLQVGVIQNGATAADLFVDVSQSGQTVQNLVQWGGTFIPPAGSPPAFTVKPVSLPAATQDVPYTGQTLAGSATDPDPGTTLTFAKFSGPAWLQVAANGTVSGTPSVLNSGLNTWQISVTDGSRFDTATLNITVAAGPRWNDGNNNFSYPNAVQNLPYADTLATNVIYYGSQTLVFAKLSGPDWLQVAANGALSGTPAQSNVLENVWTVSVTDNLLSTNIATLRIWVNGSPKFVADPFSKAKATVGQDYGNMVQTLAGSAVDPQDFPITYTKVSGPDWLTVDPTGALFGTPAAGNAGDNFWTVAAGNGSYPVTTATLKITVQAGMPTGPVEVVSIEYWDGLANPHASEGVVLTGAGTIDDPATYTIPRGLSLKDSGAIYTSQPGGRNTELNALHLRFNIEGNLTLNATNNVFFTGVHHRDTSPAQKQLILDLNGTNSILGAGQIIGLTDENDTPRILTITNVNEVQLVNIDLRVQNANNWGRPLFIYAQGTVDVPGTIDNSDRDGGGDGGNHVTIWAKVIKVGSIDTRSFRTASFRNVGNITLKALAPPGYNPADGANNTLTNAITVSGLLAPTTPQDDTTWGSIACESVILRLESGAVLQTAASKLTLNVGKIQNGASAGDLFVNGSAGSYAPNFTVDWSGSLSPSNPTIKFSLMPPGQLALTWAGSGFVLQQNTNVGNPNGWMNAPSGTNMPANVTVGEGNLFYRLKWPQ